MQNLKVSNSFTESLPGDSDTQNIPRQVMNACYSFVMPKGMADPELIIYNKELAKDLFPDPFFCSSPIFTSIMSGNTLAEGSKPFAMCYGGHQFGYWAGQLGDGRAINLGETDSLHGPLNLQLKGAGPTPYSRTADGFAVLRSSIREYLCSESMHFLGIPTTRALSLTLTGEEVLRDVMYNGNALFEPGAVICRVAPNFIRFGNFELLSYRNEIDILKSLTDYTIQHYFPHLTGDEHKYLRFFKEVSDRTCDLIVEWRRVGFVHGVLNTDNMSISGLTLDYGPFGWIDNYDPDWTPNTTDLPGKRYRYGNQHIIAQWNLLQLANALFPLIKDEEGLKTILYDFKVNYYQKYQDMMLQKMGLFEASENDKEIITETEALLELLQADMTLFFRKLSGINTNSNENDWKEIFRYTSYIETVDRYLTQIISWGSKYRERLKSEKLNDEERKEKMNVVNPKYVLRNYMAQMAIEQAEKNNYVLLHELHEMLKRPYDEQPEYEKWFAKRPDWAKEKIGCSMLSCSS